jgi:GDP-L-galactose phosphorylase
MVDPAVFEMSGHIVLKRLQDFEVADQAWAWRLLEYASVTEECFNRIVNLCMSP